MATGPNPSIAAAAAITHTACRALPVTVSTLLPSPAPSACSVAAMGWLRRRPAPSGGQAGAKQIGEAVISSCATPGGKPVSYLQARRMAVEQMVALGRPADTETAETVAVELSAATIRLLASQAEEVEALTGDDLLAALYSTPLGTMLFDALAPYDPKDLAAGPWAAATLDPYLPPGRRVAKAELSAITGAASGFLDAILARYDEYMLLAAQHDQRD